MLEGYMRSWYQRTFVDKVAQTFVTIISPNWVTMFALFFGLLVPFCLYFSSPVFALICVLLSGYFDTLDGSIARLNDATTNSGAILDIITDRTVEFAIVFGLYLVNPTSRALLIICMLGSMLLCITSFLVVGIFAKNDGDKDFYYSPGLIERAETFIFFVLMILFPGWFVVLAIIFATLVLLTAIHRIILVFQKSY